MFSPSRKPTWYETANYFQTQANRTRDPDRKAHYQRCADEYLAKAKEAESEAHERRKTFSANNHHGPADSGS